jgi:hypothetical protein
MPYDIRSIEEVATRIQCLAAVVARAVAEHLLRGRETLAGFVSFTGGEPHDAHLRINRWLDEQGLRSSLSPKEKTSLAKVPGGLTEREFLDGWWRREALVALEWSVGIIEPMPLADAQFPIEDVLEASWFFRDPAEFRQKLLPRASTEISRQRDAAELWLWRVRTTHLLRLNDHELAKHRVSRATLEDIVRKAAEAGARGGLFHPIDGDFPALGKAFRDLDDAEWDLLKSISTERLYGLNWLCNVDAPAWDDVALTT